MVFCLFLLFIFPILIFFSWVLVDLEEKDLVLGWNYIELLGCRFVCVYFKKISPVFLILISLIIKGYC